jgi:hypothetical protein
MVLFADLLYVGIVFTLAVCRFLFADILYAGNEAQIWRPQEGLEVLFLLPCEDWNDIPRNMASCELFPYLLQNLKCQEVNYHHYRLDCLALTGLFCLF